MVKKYLPTLFLSIYHECECDEFFLTLHDVPLLSYKADYFS